MTIRNLPSLRFREFSGEWNIKKFGNYLSIPKKEPVKVDDVNQLMTLRLNLNGVYKGSTSNVLKLGSTKYYKRHKGQLIYGKQNFFNGSMAIVPDEFDGLATSSDVPGFNVDNIDEKYLYFYISRRDFYKMVEKYASGTGSKRLHEDEFLDLNINVPSLLEQRKLGMFFKKINSVIEAHSRKLEQLEEFKHFYLQRMFPRKNKDLPRLRFKAFRDKWIKVKLGKLLKHNNEKNKDLSITNVESVSNKKGFLKQTDQFEDYSVASKDLSNYIVIRPGMFAYNPSRINVGSIALKDYSSKPSVVSPLYVSFKTNEKIYDDFLLYWFKTEQFKYQRERYSEGGVRDTLSFKLLTNFEFSLPSLEEQKKISIFLNKIDHLIEQQNKKIHSINDVKKYYLQKMFI